MRTQQQTIVLPDDPREFDALMHDLLESDDADAAWDRAHAKYGGDDLVITTKE